MSEPQAVPPARVGGQYLDGAWHRLHPATPLLRGGIGLVAVLAWVVGNFREQAVRWVIGAPDDGDPVGQLQRAGLVPVAVLVAVGVLVVCIAIFTVAWRTSEFRIDGDAVTLRRGVLFRSVRTARLDRIQGVTLSRPFFARLVGAARVELDVAGNDANVRLEYLSSGAAEELRRDVLAVAAGHRRRDAAEHGEPGAALDEAPASPESVIVAVTPLRAVGSVLAGRAVVVFVLVLAVGIPLLAGIGGPPATFGLVPFLFGIVTVSARRIGRNLRFTVTATDDGVRIGAGLLSTSSEAVPPGRIHAVHVEQPLFWRPMGWWVVRVNRAGRIGGRRNADLERSIAPVATFDEVLALLPHLIPDLRTQEAVVREGLIGDDGFVTAPRRARWLRPIAWRRTGFALADGVLLIRGGWFRRRCTLLPEARIQSVSREQNPAERLLGVATIAPHVVAGPVRPAIQLVDAARSSELFDQLATLGAAARALDRSHRWRDPDSA